MTSQPNTPASPTQLEILEAIDRLGDQAMNTAGPGEGFDNAQADWELVRAAAAAAAPAPAAAAAPFELTPVIPDQTPAARIVAENSAAVIRAYNLITDEDFTPESIQAALLELTATIRRNTLSGALRSGRKSMNVVG